MKWYVFNSQRWKEGNVYDFRFELSIQRDEMKCCKAIINRVYFFRHTSAFNVHNTKGKINLFSNLFSNY